MGSLLVEPQQANGLRQGITTEFLGIDGMSYAPLSPVNYRIYRRWLGGLLGDPPVDLDMSSVSAFRSHYHKKVAINTAYLVPSATVRLEVVGFHDVPLVGDSLKKAKRLVQEGIEQGAVGYTTGSSYYPGHWSTTEELVELCKVVHEAGGIYMSEPRSANPERAFGRGGTTEALEIARQSGVRLHFAHYRTSAQNAGRVVELMHKIDQAKAEGVDCTLDIYPYPTGSSIPINFLPSYAQEGGPDAIIRRLEDPKEKSKISDYLEREQYSHLEETVFSYLPKNSHLEGMSLAEIATRRGASMGQTLCSEVDPISWTVERLK